MTGEEMERAIEFVLEQQAQCAQQQLHLASDLQDLRAEHAESYRRLSDAVLTVTGQLGILAQAQEKTEARVTELADRVNDLTERVNAFIVYVERYIEETRRGKHN